MESMRLYTRVRLKKHIERLLRADVREIPIAQVAADLTRKYKTRVSRSYVHWYCQTRGIPTQGKSRKENACVYCGQPVYVQNNRGPYDKHKTCHRKATLQYVSCDYPPCDKKVQRAPSQINDRNFCSYEHFNMNRKLELSPV
jgi:hypothetical protein